MELPTPLFIEGPPLDLIKVSLGYAAMFAMNMCHMAPPEQQRSSAKRNLLCTWGIHRIQLAFTGANGFFCLDLLLNWFLVSEESIFSLYFCLYL